MIKRIDRYLLREFLKPLAASVAIFCILVTLGRFFDKMSIFTDYHAKLKDIAAYLLWGLPFWLSLVLPVATLLALLFSLGQHQQRGELNALRGAGVATVRIYTPYFCIGLVLSILSLIGGLTFLPACNFKARRVYRLQIKHEPFLTTLRDNIVTTGQNNRRFTIGWLDAGKNEMRNVVVDRFDEASHPIETLSAERALYQNGQWIFYNGTLIRYDPNQKGLFQEEPFTERKVDIPEKPMDFLYEDKKPEDMSGREILERLRRLRRLGVPAYKEHVALHLKWSLPFANLIVIALGIPFGLRSSHKGKIQTFGYALGLAFLYWGTVSTCQSYGEQGRMAAWIAGWFPNLLFSAVAVWRLRRT